MKLNRKKSPNKGSFFYFAKFTLPIMRRIETKTINLYMEELIMENNKGKLEMITVVDEYGCVVSIEFIHNGVRGDKVTIIREEGKES